MYISHISVSVSTTLAVTGPHGQLASFLFLHYGLVGFVSIFTFILSMMDEGPWNTTIPVAIVITPSCPILLKSHGIYKIQARPNQ